MKYGTLFFDLDNTLLDFNRSEYNAIRRVLEMNGLPATDETAALYSDINRKFWEAFERGEIPREAIFAGRFRELIDTLGLDTDAERLSEDYFEILAAGHDVIPGAYELLEWINGRGIKVYATTNGIAKTQHRRIKDSGLEKMFSGVFISEEIGAQKPAREYFEYVLAHIAPVRKENVLVIGDSQSSDILGGINCGLDTCWYNPQQINGKYKPTYEIKALGELKDIL